MARSVGPAGMLDVYSSAVEEDVTFAEDPYAPGTSPIRRERYYANISSIEDGDDPENARLYDRRKDWLSCAATGFICAVVIGVLHSLPLFIPQAKFVYRMSTLEVTVISAGTYATVYLFSPLAAVFVRCMGHRLTCIFGLVVMSVGLILDALELHVSVYYISHFVLVGLGACFALTAATCSVVRHFRKRLNIALAVTSAASPFGTALIQSLVYVFLDLTPMTYRWIVIIFAILVLVCLALTHVLPGSIKPLRHPDPFIGQESIPKAPKHCLEEVRRDLAGGNQVDCAGNLIQCEEEEERKSCLCICVLDLSALSDMPFVLWATLSSCGTLTLYIPYLFIPIHVMLTFGMSLLDALYLMLWLCLGSLIARLIENLNKNHTYFFSRTIFQVGVTGSAVLYACLPATATFGWFVVWCQLTGFFEGLLVGVIPRLTLLTTPRRYVPCCWVYLVMFNGLSLLIGPYLIMSVRQNTGGDITVACVTICIIQFTAVILSFFLPNEEHFETSQEADNGLNDHDEDEACEEHFY